MRASLTFIFSSCRIIIPRVHALAQAHIEAPHVDLVPMNDCWCFMFPACLELVRKSCASQDRSRHVNDEGTTVSSQFQQNASWPIILVLRDLRDCNHFPRRVVLVLETLHIHTCWTCWVFFGSMRCFNQPNSSWFNKKPVQHIPRLGFPQCFTVDFRGKGRRLCPTTTLIQKLGIFHPSQSCETLFCYHFLTASVYYASILICQGTAHAHCSSHQGAPD